MERKKSSNTFGLIKGVIKLFYPKITVHGLENLPDGEAIFVGNHSQLHGPIMCELYFPVKRYTWCAGQLMRWREVHGYAYEDFWSKKPPLSRPFYKMLSYVITPLSVCVFNNAQTIGVWHDTRILTTFRDTVSVLEEGTSIVVFPEHDVKYNNVIYDFQDKFVDTARFYFKKTGREVPFVPVYLAPRLKSLYIGKPIYFSSSAPIDEERARIIEYLKCEITNMATSLPLHTVVPYRNVPKRFYPKNIPCEVTVNEKNHR